MSSAWSLPNVPPPSPAQLALALTIVKTRPRQLDIREYLLSLRSCIKSGRHTQPPAQRAYEEQPRECGAEHVELDADKRIDSITFWRQAYEKSEAAQAALLDRIYDLEARDAAARAQSAYVGGLPASATEKKPPRKVTGMGGAGAMTSSGLIDRGTAPTKGRRSKTACPFNSKQAVLPSLGFRSPAIDDASLSAGLPASATPVLRHLHYLQKAIQQRKPNPQLIAKHCIALSMACEQAEAAGVDAARRASTTDEPARLSEILTVVTSCIAFVAKGMTKLRTIGSTDPTPLRGAVAYNVVELFRKSLQYMKQYALLAAEAQTRAASTAGRKKVIKAYKSCKSRAANTRAAAAAQPSPLVRGTLDRFAQLLHTMLAATAGLNGGLSLTEGLMFFLLETAGWLLSQLTFSGMQSDAALVDDSQTLPAIAMDPVLHGANDEAATRAAQWLCRYIVWLLQQALQVGGSGGQGTLTRPTPNLLARLGKSRLQRTVLRAIFGAECFQDGLASMAPPAVKLQHKEGDEGITDWYTQELWQLVGWDVLSTAAANPTQAA